MPRGRPKGSKNKNSQVQKQSNKQTINININDKPKRKYTRRSKKEEATSSVIPVPVPAPTNFGSMQAAGRQMNNNVQWLPYNMPSIVGESQAGDNLMNRIINQIEINGKDVSLNQTKKKETEVVPQAQIMTPEEAAKPGTGEKQPEAQQTGTQNKPSDKPNASITDTVAEKGRDAVQDFAYVATGIGGAAATLQGGIYAAELVSPGITSRAAQSIGSGVKGLGGGAKGVFKGISNAVGGIASTISPKKAAGRAAIQRAEQVTNQISEAVNINNTATKIQNAVRSKQARNLFNEVKAEKKLMDEATAKIQGALRANLARQSIKEGAATKIQQAMKSKLIRNKITKQKQNRLTAEMKDPSERTAEEWDMIRKFEKLKRKKTGNNTPASSIPEANIINAPEARNRTSMLPMQLFQTPYIKANNSPSAPSTIGIGTASTRTPGTGGTVVYPGTPASALGTTSINRSNASMSPSTPNNSSGVSGTTRKQNLQQTPLERVQSRRRRQGSETPQQKQQRLETEREQRRAAAEQRNAAANAIRAAAATAIQSAIRRTTAYNNRLKDRYNEGKRLHQRLFTNERISQEHGYGRGRIQRQSDEANNTTRELAYTLNPNSPYNQGYFGLFSEARRDATTNRPTNRQVPKGRRPPRNNK